MESTTVRGYTLVYLYSVDFIGSSTSPTIQSCSDSTQALAGHDTIQEKVFSKALWNHLKNFRAEILQIFL